VGMHCSMTSIGIVTLALTEGQFVSKTFTSWGKTPVVS